MAFISVAPTRLLPRRARTPSPATRMSVLDDVASGCKVALITGALAMTTMTTSAPPARAEFLRFPAERPTNLGLQYGRYLQYCPASPNCISSMANVYDSHFVPAWTYAAGEGAGKSMQDAISDVLQVISEYPRTRIITSEDTNSEVGNGHYIYAEFESKLLGFVDDVEFFFTPDNRTVEYRSASRLGEKDFDVNRKRIRSLRVALQEMDQRWASVGK